MTDLSVGEAPTDVPPAPGTAVARGDAPEPSGGSRPGTPLFTALRPVGPGGVLDGAFDMLRSRFGRLVGLAACIFVPIRLLDLVTMVWTGAATERYHIGPSLLLLGGESGWSWVVVVLQSLGLSVLGICVGALVARQLDGDDPGFGDLARVALRRGWVALGIVPLSLAVRAPFACIPLAFVLGETLVFITSVVAGAESLGPWRAVRRGVRLVRSAFGVMLVVNLGGLLVSQVLRVSFYTGPVLLVGTFSSSETVLTAVGQAGALVVLVAEPLTACVAARAYLELRCRKEGLDLRSRTQERFA